MVRKRFEQTIPATKTKSFKVLYFIGTSLNGRTSTEVKRFIVEELLGRDWDSKKGAGLWNTSLYGFGTRQGLFERFCIRLEKRWYLTTMTSFWINQQRVNPGERKVVGPPTPQLSQLDLSRIRDLSVENAERLPMQHDDTVAPAKPETLRAYQEELTRTPDFLEEGMSVLKELQDAKLKFMYAENSYKSALERLQQAEHELAKTRAKARTTLAL